MTATFQITANIVDIPGRRTYPGTVMVRDGKIAAIQPAAGTPEGFILPGFIDAHVHVESSMMVPSEFARFAVVHGTVGTVSDPHEIANVLGVEGVRLMADNGRRVPFKFHFGVPSCVPATNFESAGATIDAAAFRELFVKDGLGYLSEMMNFPGVLFADPEVMAKLEVAKSFGKPIDGHAPGLRGDEARRYIAAGPSTDHECFTLDEALDKVQYGMKILIREGSAAKNFGALHSLLTTHPTMCMLCSDDLHPDSLIRGHINLLVKRAVAEGHDLFNVLHAACVHPVQHYSLPVGLLRVGDPADFILVDDLENFRVRKTWIDGRQVAEEGQSRIDRVECPARNNFNASPVSPDDFRLPARGGNVRVIQAVDGQLVTNEVIRPESAQNGEIVSDATSDVLKIVVVNRYQKAKPAVALIHNFGLKRGAIAASVAHDSHNIVAVGVTDLEICAAVEALMKSQGGLAVADGKKVDVLPLEVAGLMSRDGAAVAAGYTRLDAAAKALGSSLSAPFMTLSFMALLVIPALKLSDKGLFNGKTFQFTSVHV